MASTIFNENEIEQILVNVVKKLRPSYKKISPLVIIRTEEDFRGTKIDYADLIVNCDNFGRIYQADGKLVAQNYWGVDVLTYANSIEEGIRFLVKTYRRAI